MRRCSISSTRVASAAIGRCGAGQDWRTAYRVVREVAKAVLPVLEKRGLWRYPAGPRTVEAGIVPFAAR
ncbi:hypothetical protein [Streptomyces sp. SCL15-4]|uniref:hypothetical protein n=1 Tax=Streptomyces sp. SCL15-4 TaxID=2967221 RepID=UPI0029666AE4|nr:hypothetical protein [Streptomyces sp. SCL15-4]